jgi:hypothetical protein
LTDFGPLNNAQKIIREILKPKPTPEHVEMGERLVASRWLPVGTTERQIA